MKKRDNENYTVLVDVAESDGKKSKKAAKKQIDALAAESKDIEKI